MKKCWEWYLQKQVSEVFSCLFKRGIEYKDLPEQVFLLVKNASYQYKSIFFLTDQIQNSMEQVPEQIGREEN